MRDWYSTHLSFTDKTFCFDKLSENDRKTFLDKLALEIPEEIILISIFDENNFALITEKRVIWLCDSIVDEASFSDIIQLHHEGGLLDERYEQYQLRFYKDGSIVATNDPNSPDISTLGRENDIRLSSPIVFVKVLGGHYKTFKMEAGIIDSIIVGVFISKNIIDKKRLNNFLFSLVATVIVCFALLQYAQWHWEHVRFSELVNQLNQLSKETEKKHPAKGTR